MFARAKVERNAEFEALALPLLDSAYNFAYWLAQNRDEAEDLVQEAFAKALRGFAGFQPGTNFKAWMFRILKNTFLTSRTGLREVTMTDADDAALEVADPRDNPELRLAQLQNRDALAKALESLPVAYREVILLCDVEEMKYQEIAEALGIPIGTVMSRLGRGRRMMRERLSTAGVNR